MAFSTHEFKLDLTPGASRPVVYASAGDIGRPFKANLYWNGSAWTATGTNVKIRGKKPDKTVFEYDSTDATVDIEVDGSSVWFDTSEQMTIIPGSVECELVFTDGVNTIATANFVLIVEESPYNPDALSESDVEGLTDVLEGFQRLNRGSNGVVKIGDGVTASGTAEPIKGFYVHDEESNTDGVAKVSIDAVQEFEDDIRDEAANWLENNPDIWSPIPDDSLTTPKLVDEAVTTEKLSKNVQSSVFPPYLFVPHLDASFDPTGACFAFIYKERVTLLDLGRYETFSTIEQQLKERGVTAIDNIFITHWHPDHDSSNGSGTLAQRYDQWKNAFDMGDTKWYIPREAPSEFAASNGYAAVMASFDGQNITIIDNDTVVNWNEIEFSVKNQSDADYAYYKTLGSTDLNYCSALIYAKYNDFVFLDTGDILSSSQKWCVEKGYIKPANIVTIPHHGVTASSYSGFMEIVKPQYAYIPNNIPALTYGNPDGNIWKAELTATVFDNVENPDGVEFYFNNGVTAKGTPVINSGVGSTQPRQIYVNENVTAGSEQDGTEYKPYKDIRNAISKCRGLTSVYLLSDITGIIALTGMNGTVTINGNNHSIANYSVEAGNVTFNDVVFNGNGVISDSKVYYNSPTFKKDNDFYRSFVNFKDVTLESTRLANHFSYCYGTIAGVSGDTGTYSNLINEPYCATITITANTTGKEINKDGMRCITNETPSLSTGGKSVSVSASTETLIDTVTVPHGNYLLVSYMDLSSSVSDVYMHKLATSSVSNSTRTNGTNGGGCINVINANNQTIEIKAYVPSACTVRVKWYLLKISD